MKLHLVDDLPLFRRSVGSDPGVLVRQAMDRLLDTIPAELTFVSHAELERLWRGVIATDCDTLLLVGTRPPLLTHRTSALGTDRVVRLATRRALDETGRTASVHVTKPDGDAVAPLSGRLLIADDVAMSANTLLTVLAMLDLPATAGSVMVRTIFATRRAVERISQTGIDLTTAVTLDYEPITQGTTIFLWDLLYGTLRGIDFLDQTELLRPFLGTQLAPLRDLRRALDETSVPGPALSLVGSVDA